MRVRKAVLPAAGFGTRFLPATKANPKEMVTLVDRPIIQYAVEEAVSSGIEQIIIVTAHEKRRFIPKVDFITSPGWLAGGGSRQRAGLLFGGVSRVVTTLGIFGFDPDPDTAPGRALQVLVRERLVSVLVLTIVRPTRCAVREPRRAPRSAGARRQTCNDLAGCGAGPAGRSPERQTARQAEKACSD